MEGASDGPGERIIKFLPMSIHFIRCECEYFNLQSCTDGRILSLLSGQSQFVIKQHKCQFILASFLSFFFFNYYFFTFL